MKPILFNDKYGHFVDHPAWLLFSYKEDYAQRLGIVYVAGEGIDPCYYGSLCVCQYDENTNRWVRTAGDIYVFGDWDQESTLRFLMSFLYNLRTRKPRLWLRLWRYLTSIRPTVKWSMG